MPPSPPPPPPLPVVAMVGPETVCPGEIKGGMPQDNIHREGCRAAGRGQSQTPTTITLPSKGLEEQSAEHDRVPGLNMQFPAYGEPLR